MSPGIIRRLAWPNRSSPHFARTVDRHGLRHPVASSSPDALAATTFSHVTNGSGKRWLPRVPDVQRLEASEARPSALVLVPLVSSQRRLREFEESTHERPQVAAVDGVKPRLLGPDEGRQERPQSSSRRRASRGSPIGACQADCSRS